MDIHTLLASPRFIILLQILMLGVGLAIWFHHFRKLKARTEALARRLGGTLRHAFFLSSPAVGIPAGRTELILSFRSRTKHSPPYTVLSAHLPFHAGWEMRVRPEGFEHRIGKFFGMQDIQVNVSEFDQAFVIKGNDETRVRQFLSGTVSQRLLSMRSWRPELSVRKGKFRLAVPEHLERDDDLLALIEHAKSILAQAEQVRS